MFKSKRFWGGVLLCGVVIFLGILMQNASQPQETITIYKTVTPERRVKSQPSDRSTVQPSDDGDETEVASNPVDSDVPTAAEDFSLADTRFTETETQTEENTLSADAEAENVTEPEPERFFGLTLAEIEEKIPVLENEIRTNLTKAVELYAELRSTDGLASKSPEVAAWRHETWQEVKQLFQDLAYTGKILRYRSFLKGTGVEGDPILPGGWIYELMEPLPMQVTPGGTSQ